MATVTLYYDCLSPFSFFAYTVLSRCAALRCSVALCTRLRCALSSAASRRYVGKVWPAELVLKPCLLGGVVAATGNTPPGARPWAASTAKVRSPLAQLGLFGCSVA